MEDTIGNQTIPYVSYCFVTKNCLWTGDEKAITIFLFFFSSSFVWQTNNSIRFHCSMRPFFLNRFMFFFPFFLCKTDENDIALLPLNLTKSRSNNLHHSHQHIFQHQSSVSSTASVQTVFHNIDTNSIANASNNQMVLLGTSSSSASFQSANGNSHATNANGHMGKSSDGICATD